MPIHGWARVTAGTFHDFHSAWLGEIRTALNTAILPSDYYAQAEQVAGELKPDVLALQASDQAEAAAFVRRKNVLVIRHSSGDRIIAFLEIVSPGNKNARHAFRRFVDRAARLVSQGYHLLMIDLIPPGPRDPRGSHAAVWEELCGGDYTAPPDKPLTVASYEAGPVPTA